MKEVIHENDVLTVRKVVQKKKYEATMPLAQRLHGRRDILASVLESWIDRYVKTGCSEEGTEVREV